jgi:hypothetical protein
VRYQVHIRRGYYMNPDEKFSRTIDVPQMDAALRMAVLQIPAPPSQYGGEYHVNIVRIGSVCDACGQVIP